MFQYRIKLGRFQSEPHPDADLSSPDGYLVRVIARKWRDDTLTILAGSEDGTCFVGKWLFDYVGWDEAYAPVAGGWAVVGREEAREIASSLS